MITGRGKAALEEHFDRNCRARARAGRQGRPRRGWPRSVARPSSRRSTTSAQGDPLGLGHAVLCAAEHVGNEPFAVLLGDDLIDPRDPLLSTHDRGPGTLRRQRDRADGGAAGADQPLRLRGRPADREPDRLRPTSSLVTDLVEKPRSSDAPSNLAVIGRYLLDPSVFDVLRQTPPGRGGEIQLTDALQHLAGPTGARRRWRRRHGVLFRGRRYDTGDRLEYLARWSSSRVTGWTSPRTSCPGSAVTWPTCPEEAGPLPGLARARQRALTARTSSLPAMTTATQQGLPALNPSRPTSARSCRPSARSNHRAAPGRGRRRPGRGRHRGLAAARPSTTRPWTATR